MSDDRLFERNAQVWLEVGPTTAPKRVVDAALLAIETTSQQRDLRAPWRLPHLTFNTRLAVAAAVGLLVVGAGVLILRNPQNQIGTPSPSPTAINSASPSAISLEQLRGSWASIGERNDPLLKGASGGPSRFQSIAIDAAGLRINGWRAELTSSASFADADGQLALRMDTPQESLNREHWDCVTGDNGTYNASLSSDGQTLTLTSANDECASRDEILTGDWTRWSCPTSQYASCNHVSELAPGRYVSPVFRPFWAGPGHTGPASGQLAYTVAAGWANLTQPPTWPGPGGVSAVWLTRLDAPGSQAITIFSNSDPIDAGALPRVPEPTCTATDDAPSANAAQVVDFLESLPYLSTSGRAPITIDGLTGVQIDVSLVPGFVDPCNTDTNAVGQLTYSTEIGLIQNYGAPGGGVYLNYATDAYARLIVLDTHNGSEVIVVTAPDLSSLEARLVDAMPVIETFEFIP